MQLRQALRSIPVCSQHATNSESPLFATADREQAERQFEIVPHDSADNRGALYLATVAQIRAAALMQSRALPNSSFARTWVAGREAQVKMGSVTRLRDWLLLLACNFIWASQFVLVKIVQAQMGPVAATFLPMAVSTIMLVPIVAWEGRHNGVGRGRMPGRDIFEFIVIGVFGQVVAQLFITWGMRYAPASNAALLMLALPVSTAVMAYFVLGERMTLVRWTSFALAIAGVLECSGIDWNELNMTSTKFLIGNVLIFASVNGSAFYNVYSKKLLTRYTPLEVLLYSYYAVITFLLPITLYVEPQGFRNIPQFTPAVWGGLLALAVFQYFLSMVIFLTVLTRLDATQASLSNYLIPFFGVIIAAVVMHEPLTMYMIAGGLLVLGSTLLVTVYEERRRARERPALARTGT